MQVRVANAADIPAMMALQHESLSAAQWSRQQYEGLFVAISAEQLSERVAWVAEEVAEEVAEDESGVDEVLAFLVAHRIGAEWELENIAVAARVRRRGIASRLVGDFVAHTRNDQGTEIFLEVRESNQSARAFYRKAGFEETGLRKSYYSNPAENAILCRRKLC